MEFVFVQCFDIPTFMFKNQNIIECKMHEFLQALHVFKPIQLSNKTQFDGRCHCAVSSHNTSNDNDET